MKSSLPIALAILLGFSFVAIAIYFGLAAQGKAPSAPIAPKAVFKEVKSDWESVSSETKSTAVVATPYKNVKNLTRDRGVFRTTWRKHRVEVEQICRTHANVKFTSEDRYLEMPIEMKIDSAGTILAARRFTDPRILKNDGSAAVVKLSDSDLKPWTTCLINEIVKRVKFPPNAGEEVLRVWVPLKQN